MSDKLEQTVEELKQVRKRVEVLENSNQASGSLSQELQELKAKVGELTETATKALDDDKKDIDWDD